MILNESPVNTVAVNDTVNYVLLLRAQGSIYLTTSATNYLYSSFSGSESSINLSSYGKITPSIVFKGVPSVFTVSSTSTGYYLYSYLKSLNNYFNFSSTSNLYNYVLYNANTSNIGIRSTGILTPSAILQGEPSSFTIDSLSNKYVVEARLASSASIKLTSSGKTFFQSTFSSLSNSINVSSIAKNKFLAKLESTPSTFNLQSKGKTYLAIKLGKTIVSGSFASYAERYNIVQLSDSIFDDRAYIVEPLELNYDSKRVILDFYPQKIMFDLYSSTDSLELNA